VVSWIVGYVHGNFTYTVQGWLAGLVLALLVRMSTCVLFLFDSDFLFVGGFVAWFC
jgi:hypothetical protein